MALPRCLIACLFKIYVSCQLPSCILSIFVWKCFVQTMCARLRLFRQDFDVIPHVQGRCELFDVSSLLLRSGCLSWRTMKRTAHSNSPWDADKVFYAEQGILMSEMNNVLIVVAFSVIVACQQVLSHLRWVCLRLTLVLLSSWCNVFW